MCVEHSDKQVKRSLGWRDYQIRNNLVIRRYRQWVGCTFALCWWACGGLEESVGAPPEVMVPPSTTKSPAANHEESAGRGKRTAKSSLPMLWPQVLRKVGGDWNLTDAVAILGAISGMPRRRS